MIFICLFACFILVVTKYPACNECRIAFYKTILFTHTNCVSVNILENNMSHKGWQHSFEQVHLMTHAVYYTVHIQYTEVRIWRLIAENAFSSC